MKFIFISAGILFISLPLWSEAQQHQRADSLRLRGEEYHEKGKFPQAETAYEQAFKLYKQAGDTANWLQTGQFYAEVLAYQSKYEQAFDLFYTLPDVRHPANDKGYQARMEHDLAWVFKRQGKPEQALKHYDKGLSLAEEAQDSLMIAYLLLGAGGVYANLNDDIKSLEYKKKVLPYFKALQNPRGLAMTLNNMGMTYSKLNMPDKALDYLLQSLDIRLQLGNVNLLAAIYTNIADVLRQMGNYNQALSAYNKSLKYRKQAGNHLYTAATLNNIGVLYSELGNDEKALQYYLESQQLKKDIASPLRLATTYGNIGDKLWSLGNQREALEYYEKALSLRKGTGNAQEIARSLADLVKVERKSGNYEAASEYAMQIKAIADSSDNKNLQIRSLKWLGLIARDQGLPDKAIAHLKKAYTYSLDLPKLNQINLLKDLAGTFDQLKSDSALVYGQMAVTLIEEQRTSVVSESALRVSYFKQHSDFYINMASWMLKYRSDMAEAYRFVEMAKARSLADDLAQASQHTDEQLPEAIRIQKAKKLNHIDSLYSQLDIIQDQQKYRILERTVRRAELDYAAFQSKLSDHHSLKQLKVPSPVTLDQARNSTDEETAILEYAVTPDYLVTFFISRQEVTARQIHLTDMHDIKNLDSRIKTLTSAIQNHADKETIHSLAGDLYNLLISPFEEQLQAYSNLIVVPDGAIAHLPFEVLGTDGSYLVEHFDIKYAPSITSLGLLKKSSARQENELLAIAGSGSSDNVSATKLKRAFPYSALPATIIEVDSVAANFSRTTILKGDNVTEHSLKNLLSADYRFVHLATHGIIDERFPARSGLVVSAMDDEQAFLGGSGLLTSSEIYQMNISSEMVVLSSCKSGLGKVIKGEGMLGLQRSFFYAGASTVVVSLWDVYDRSTAYLMNEFYKAILAGEADSSWLDQFWQWIGWDESIPFGVKAKAMRKAKLKLINHPLFNHPVYWAPFIVVGR